MTWLHHIGCDLAPCKLDYTRMRFTSHEMKSTRVSMQTDYIEGTGEYILDLLAGMC